MNNQSLQINKAIFIEIKILIEQSKQHFSRMFNPTFFMCGQFILYAKVGFGLGLNKQYDR